MDPFYLALLLYTAAVVVAFVDLFVPSGGLLLILATAAAFAAVLFGFRSGTYMGMTMLTIVVASVPAFAFATLKIWPHTPLGKRIILGLPDASTEAIQDQAQSREELIGRILVAEHSLLPTGQIKFGHRRYNAIAENGIIEAGQNVEVVAIKERNLIVRISTAQPTQASPSSKIEENKSLPTENLLDLPADEFGLDEFGLDSDDSR